MTNSRYCPVHNPFGTFKDTNGKNWYESSYPINSVFDAHQNVGTELARPDSKNKGIVYKTQFIPLHTTIQEDTLFEAEKRRSEYYAGKGGVSGLVSTEVYKSGTANAFYKYSNGKLLIYGTDENPVSNSKYKLGQKILISSELGTALGTLTKLSTPGDGDIWIERWVGTMSSQPNNALHIVNNDILISGVTLPILSNKNSLMIDIIGDCSQYTSADTTTALQSTSTDTGSELRQNALVWNVAQNRMYKYKDTDDRDNVDLTAEDFTVDAKWGYVEKGYPVQWLDRLSEGKPLIGMFSNLVNVNDGSSLIPNGTRIENLLSKKITDVFTGSTKNAIFLYNKGNTVWIGANSTTNITLNGTIRNTFYWETTDSQYSTTVSILPYTTKNTPLIQSTPKPITYVSPKVVNSNSHSIYQAGLVTNSITGGIATSDEAMKLEDGFLGNTSVNENGTMSLVPSNINPILSATSSKSSKSFYAKAVDGTKHYDMIFGQELIDSGSGDYKSTKFTNLTNGTTTDDNGTTVNTKVLAVQNQYRR